MRTLLPAGGGLLSGRRQVVAGKGIDMSTVWHVISPVPTAIRSDPDTEAIAFVDCRVESARYSFC